MNRSRLRSALATLALAALFAALALSAPANEPQAPTESDFLSRVRRLTFEGKRAGEGYFSPDGKKLVFQSEREPGNPFFQIYLLDLETGDTKRISPGLGKTTCPFIQPGTGNIIYASTHLDPQAEADQREEIALRESGKERRYSWDYDEDFDVFLATPDAAFSFPLTRAKGYDAECSFSPDGSKIAFSSNRHIYEGTLADEDKARLEIDKAFFCEIYIMDASGANQTRLTFAPGYDGGPFFTADGERIIWRRFDEHGLTADVYTMRLDGSDVRRLTDFGAMSWAPYMHPTGEYAIFATNKQGFENFELYLVDSLGAKEPVRATFTDGFDGLPVFSPDGKMLAWTSSRETQGGGQLFLADWNHAAAQKALAASPERQQAAPAIAGEEAPSVPDLETAPSDKGEESASAAPASSEEESLSQGLRRRVEYLASDKLEGRMTGSEGERLAWEFLVQELQAIGLEPFGPGDEWIQPFEFNSGVVLGEGNEMTLRLEKVALDPMGHGSGQGGGHSSGGHHGGASPSATAHHGPTSQPTSRPTTRPAAEKTPAEKTPAEEPKSETFAPETTYIPLSFSTNGEFSGGVVFAGYGLESDDDKENPYNSFKGLDLKDRWVLMFRFAPEGLEGERRRDLWRRAGLTHKAQAVKARGAKGVIIVEGPNSNAGKTALLPVESGAAVDLGVHAINILPELGDRLLAQAGTSLKEIQDALDGGNPIPGFPIPGATISAKVDLIRGKATGHNVLAVLPPPGGLTPETTFYVLGAHYDHLGRGISGSSLARTVEEGQIHNGADDNASGTAATLAVAEILKARDRQEWRHGVIFALWSGEELGVLGSSEFLEHPPVAKERLLGYLNMDMVGRLRDNGLSVQAMGSSKAWPSILERANVAAGFRLETGDSPYLPTDSISFYTRGIPTLALFTGAHEDYHRPSDDADKVDFAGAERVARFAASLMDALARRGEPLDYVEVKREEEPGSRAGLRASLGTIPDYVADVKGVRLAGARPGSAAEKAGVRPGDVVVSLAGVEVENIYDYTYAIETLKPGVEVEIVVSRHDERLTLKVTPDSR
jgi:Tol biopolymer transport system component